MTAERCQSRGDVCSKCSHRFVIVVIAENGIGNQRVNRTRLSATTLGCRHLVDSDDVVRFTSTVVIRQMANCVAQRNAICDLSETTHTVCRLCNSRCDAVPVN